MHRCQIRKFLRCASTQICMINSANRKSAQVKSRLFTPFFIIVCTHLNQSITCCICNEKKYVFADLRKFKSANHKKIWSANRKSAKCHICGMSANLTNYLSPQICEFSICGTYLRTAYLWPFKWLPLRFWASFNTENERLEWLCSIHMHFLIC